MVRHLLNNNPPTLDAFRTAPTVTDVVAFDQRDPTPPRFQEIVASFAIAVLSGFSVSLDMLPIVR
jgi:hypothetical protein